MQRSYFSYLSRSLVGTICERRELKKAPFKISQTSTFYICKGCSISCFIAKEVQTQGSSVTPPKSQITHKLLKSCITSAERHFPCICTPYHTAMPHFFQVCNGHGFSLINISTQFSLHWPAYLVWDVQSSWRENSLFIVFGNHRWCRSTFPPSTFQEGSELDMHIA